jgi:aryl-alcohol dehydrogenase-like predicted oxidoreductase
MQVTSNKVTNLELTRLRRSATQRITETLQEFVPLAQALGMGITAWSPLGGGLLSGKYRPSEGDAKGDGRLTLAVSQGLGIFTERNWRVVAALEKVAREVGRSMAQVALNWTATQPGIGSVILGASKLAQLDDNLAALEFDLPIELRRQLDQASAQPPTFPYGMFGDAYQAWLHGGASVGDKPAGYAPPVRSGKAFLEG